MSLFDVLRYPVSIPPQQGQLEAIPYELYMLWYKSVDGWNDCYDERAASVCEYYNDPYNKSALWELDSLKKMIKEYEPV